MQGRFYSWTLKPLVGKVAWETLLPGQALFGPCKMNHLQVFFKPGGMPSSSSERLPLSGLHLLPKECSWLQVACKWVGMAVIHVLQSSLLPAVQSTSYDSYKFQMPEGKKNHNYFNLWNWISVSTHKVLLERSLTHSFTIICRCFGVGYNGRIE